MVPAWHSNMLVSQFVTNLGFTWVRMQKVFKVVLAKSHSSLRCRPTLGNHCQSDDSKATSGHEFRLEMRRRFSQGPLDSPHSFSCDRFSSSMTVKWPSSKPKENTFIPTCSRFTTISNNSSLMMAMSSRTDTGKSEKNCWSDFEPWKPGFFVRSKSLLQFFVILNNFLDAVFTF